MQSERTKTLCILLAFFSFHPQAALCTDGKDGGVASGGQRGAVASIDSELTLGVLLRSRLILEGSVARLPLSFFFIDVEKPGGRRLDLGLETPYLAFGPCTPYGFLSRLTSPRLAPAAEEVGRSELRIDRTFEAGSTHGLVAQLPGEEGAGFGTFLYLLERSSAAPVAATSASGDVGSSSDEAGSGSPWAAAWSNQTPVAGATLPLFHLLSGAEEAQAELQSRAVGIGVVAGSSEDTSVELLAQAIGFPTPKRSEDWLTSEPLFPGGSALHSGVRFSSKRGALTLSEEASASITSSLPAAFALSTDVALDTGFLQIEGRPKQRLRLRGQGECVGRDYVTSYESYAADALHGRLLGEWQVGTINLSGRFDTAVGQTAQIPTAFKRLCREGSIGVEVELPPFSAGAGMRSRRTDGEDGSVLLVRSYFGDLALECGVGTFLLELTSSRENRKPGPIDGRVGFLAGNDVRSFAGSLIVEEGCVGIETEGELGLGDSTFYAKMRAGEHLKLTIGTRVRITTGRRK